MLSKLKMPFSKSAHLTLKKDLAAPQVPLDPLQILEHTRAQLVPKHGVCSMRPGLVSRSLSRIFWQRSAPFRFRFIVEKSIVARRGKVVSDDHYPQDVS
jgi:hypothetical protein